MVGKQKIYEGKAKVIFKGPKDGTLIQYFKDDATAFNAKKFDVLDGKGEINNLISEFLMNTIKDLYNPSKKQLKKLLSMNKLNLILK